MIHFLLRTFVRDYTNVTDPRVRASCGRLAGVVGILANVLLFGVKIAAAVLCSSVSIAADAVNNLADASSSVISLLGFRMAAKPADPEHPYGHARYEYLSGLLIAVLILLIGWEILSTGVGKILTPTPTVFSTAACVILGASILVKLWLALFNSRLGKLIDSSSLTASAADSRNDVISTGAVLLCSVLSHFLHIQLDGWVGVAVAVFILYSGIGLVRETVDPLLGRAPEPEMVSMILRRVQEYPGVLGTHDLMIHDYGPGRQFASIHVEMAAEVSILESHDVIDNIERDFLHRDGIHLIAHLDPVVLSDPHVAEVREFLIEAARELHERLSVHDLRLVPGKTHTNVVFDCVVPADIPLSQTEICAGLRKKVSERFPDHFCVITIDENYAGQ